MASEMQERVAMAIYEGRNGRGCAPWARLPGSHKAPYLADALAAMDAMREPTPGMLDAMQRAWTPGVSYGEAHAIRFQAALDAEIEAAKKG